MDSCQQIVQRSLRTDARTYSFLNLTKLLKLLAKSVLIGVPGKASVMQSAYSITTMECIFVERTQ